MKRVKAACICQTLQFLPKDGFGRDYAAKLVRDEVAQYKAGLERGGAKYRLIDETAQPDGSILLKVIRQYNSCDVGDYLD